MTKAILALWRALPTGALARNAALATLWQLLRIATQTFTTIVVARALGPSGYGIFAGTAGLAVALGGFSGLGTGWLMLQAVSRQASDLDEYWTKAVLTTLGFGVILATLFCIAASAVTGSALSLFALIAIGLSELVCYPLILAAGFAFQAHERLGWANALPAALAASRLLGALAFHFFSDTGSLENYISWHLAASAATALIALALVKEQLQPKRSPFKLDRVQLREGLAFSSLWVSGNVVTELDKTLALRLAGSEVTGVYALAYRLASALTLPMASLMLAAQPRLFRAGTPEGEPHPALIRHLVLACIANSMVAAMVLYFAGGVLPWLMGLSFAPAVDAARLLALWPFLYSTRTLASTILMTHGHRGVRMACEMAAIALMAAASAILMPRYGIIGVVATVLITEAALSLALWLIIWRKVPVRKRH
jgi:O-antigen/teichoic acid export membrane protein